MEGEKGGGGRGERNYFKMSLYLIFDIFVPSPLLIVKNLSERIFSNLVGSFDENSMIHIPY